MSIRKSIRRLASHSCWSQIQKVNTDSIMKLTEQYKSDKNEKKVNLSIGAYKDSHGNPYILPSVQEARKKQLQTNHEYSNIHGCLEFNHYSQHFLFGEHNEDKFTNIATVQTISGTGACRLGAEFLSKVCDFQSIYLPNKTWPNHLPIMKNSGLQTMYYHYYNNNDEINSKSLFHDLFSAPDKSVFLFHVCAHNPTGIDPTHTQWKAILNIVKEKQHLVLFDCAYQGFTSGNHNIDAYPVRLFLEDQRVNFLVAQSYSKNFGLYGERIGALHVVTRDKQEKEIILSQLKSIIRPMYSNPPINGAKIVTSILSNPYLFELWKHDCKNMAKSMIYRRNTFIDKLSEEIPYVDWSSLKKQNGMFCYSSIDEDVINSIRKDYSIYMTNDGRISIPALNDKNMDYVVHAIKESYNRLMK